MRRAELEREVDIGSARHAVAECAPRLVDDRERHPLGDRRPRSRIRDCEFGLDRRWLAGLVAIEAAPRLPPEALLGDEPLLDRRGSKTLGPAEALPHTARRSEVDVDADQVHQL